VGHYFGLYHNNEGDSCVNYNCLLDGDHVCDTPPVFQPEFQPAFCNSSSCSSDMNDTSGFNPFTMDMNDISNIMLPIVGCPYLLTQGQADRMNFFLNNTRYKLLTSNGCGQHPSSNPLPTAQIGNITNNCNGYVFTSSTTNAEYIEWDFNNDGFTDAVGDSVAYFFPMQGNYTIVLRAFNEVGYDADTMIFQSLAQNNTIFPLSTFIVEGNGLFACMGTNLTLIAVPGMAHYQWSTGDTTQTIVIPVTAPINVTLTCTDSMGMVWQRCPDPTFTWDVAPSPAPFSLTLLTDDSLCTNQMFQAEIPLQPGTFAQIFSDGYPGILNNSLINLYHYQQNTNYITVVLRNINNFCPAFAEDTIHILFTAPLDSNQTPIVNGNYITVGDTAPNVQWYLDGVAIPWANSDTLFMDSIGCYYYEAWNLDRECSVLSSEYCNSIVSEKSFHADDVFRIYPNPNHGIFTISSLKGIIKKDDIFMNDITGRQILFEASNEYSNSIHIKTENLVAGIYFLKIKTKIHLFFIN
jgi:PKD repeat protein